LVVLAESTDRERTAEDASLKVKRVIVTFITPPLSLPPPPLSTIFT
jgi:hypothetical protein